MAEGSAHRKSLQETSKSSVQPVSSGPAAAGAVPIAPPLNTASIEPPYMPPVSMPGEEVSDARSKPIVVTIPGVSEADIIDQFSKRDGTGQLLLTTKGDVLWELDSQGGTQWLKVSSDQLNNRVQGSQLESRIDAALAQKIRDAAYAAQGYDFGPTDKLINDMLKQAPSKAPHRE